MKQFKIYEIPGVKIGATDRWPKRVIEQGYKGEDCNILFETDVLKLASSMEQVLQKKHGYEVDDNRYETIYNASHGRIVTEETRIKMSNSALTRVISPISAAKRSQRTSIASIKTQAEIAADPVRAAQRSQRASKAQAEIAADPVRADQRKQRMIEGRKAIQDDPTRATQQRQRIDDANIKRSMDPIRRTLKSKKLSKTTYQIDPKTGVILGVFSSTRAAAWLFGAKDGGTLSTAKRTGKTYHGFLWK